MRTMSIDGKKNDVRVLCTGPSDSPDAGLGEGVMIDPPDDKAGWSLVDIWVDHDTVQEKGEKGALTTRKVNPVFYQLWVRPKSPPKKQKKAKPMAAKAAQVAPAPAGDATEPKKKRGRQKKPTTPAVDPIETTGTEVQGERAEN